MMEHYRRAACAEADPHRQVAALLDGIARFLDVAAVAIEAGDVAVKTRAVDRALCILGYLRATLDFARGGEVAVAYETFYVELGHLVVAASVAFDASVLRHAAALLGPLHAAWSPATVSARPASDPG